MFCHGLELSAGLNIGTLKIAKTILVVFNGFCIIYPPKPYFDYFGRYITVLNCICLFLGQGGPEKGLGFRVQGLGFTWGSKNPPFSGFYPPFQES